MKFPHAYLSYVPFKGSSSIRRAELLHRNNLRNVKASYEMLENVEMFEQAECQGKKGSVRELLLNVKLNNNNSLFYGVEQGTGVHENKLFVLHNPRNRYVASKWLKKECGVDFTLNKESQHKTSIKEFLFDDGGDSYKECMKELEKTPLTKEEKRINGCEKQTKSLCADVVNNTQKGNGDVNDKSKFDTKSNNGKHQKLEEKNQKLLEKMSYLVEVMGELTTKLMAVTDMALKCNNKSDEENKNLDVTEVEGCKDLLVKSTQAIKDAREVFKQSKASKKGVRFNANDEVLRDEKRQKTNDATNNETNDESSDTTMGYVGNGKHATLKSMSWGETNSAKGMNKDGKTRMTDNNVESNYHLPDKTHM